MELTKQQEEYLDSIPKMGDEQLFNEFINQPEDSYFTEWGKVKRKFVSEELAKRLKY